jgi:hypothetical protein
MLDAAHENREAIAGYLRQRVALLAQSYTPAEAERLARGVLSGSPDVLLLGVRPGRLEGRAIARKLGSRVS